MLRAGIIFKEGASEAMELARDAVGCLVERGLEVVSLDSQTVLDKTLVRSEQEWSQGLHMAVVIGGDGTLLRAAQLINSSGIPVIGVKVGGLGFLTEVQPEELPEMIDEVIAGKARVQERMMIEGKITGDNGSESFHALNEISITYAGMPRVIDLDATINGVFVTSFRADGLLVSSPTGTTAYCMAAGGPIVHPAMKCLVITPVCPHTLTSRPLVIPEDSQVTISLATRVKSVVVTADSQKEWPLEAGQRVEIRVAPKGLSLVCSPSMNYYEILRTKLRWGER